MFARRPRLRSSLVTFGLLGALSWAAPAAAHDQLIESDPAAGATLETSPAAITLTFTADILDLATQVVVTDAAGTVLVDTPGDAEGAVLTVPVEPVFDTGDYTVTWRVVSSDGHPIDGTFAFAILPDPDALPEPTATASEPTSAPADSPGPAEDPEPGPTPTATAQAAEAPPRTDPQTSNTPVLVGALLGLAGGLVLVAVRRRRRADR